MDGFHLNACWGSPPGPRITICSQTPRELRKGSSMSYRITPVAWLRFAEKRRQRSPGNREGTGEAEWKKTRVNQERTESQARAKPEPSPSQARAKLESSLCTLRKPGGSGSRRTTELDGNRSGQFLERSLDKYRRNGQKTVRSPSERFVNEWALFCADGEMKPLGRL